MATKTESPPTGKPSPPERLARKRAAARLRQQRCRARKREGMLEQRRHQECLPVRHGSSPQDSRAEPVNDGAQGRNPPHYFSRSMGIISSPSRDPIYNCVSFDSQRSFEEAQRGPPAALISRSSSELSTSTAPSSPSSTGKPVEVITISLNQPEEPLVAKEEAAIAAMLSLKSSDSTKSLPPSPRTPEESRRPSVTRMDPKPRKFPYYRDWEAPRYGYGRQGHGPPPPYYGMGMPHRVTPPQYRYYPAFKVMGYSRFDYEL
jgi:hypothetical protein